jgi:predicted dehydrogenase
LTGYNLRFLPSLQRFRALLNEQTIGRVLSARCEAGQYLPTWRPDADYRQSVSARRELGGGVLLELSHELDYLRWIFGEVDWVQATLTRQSGLDVDVEDSAHLILGFNAEQGPPPIASVYLDFVRRDTTRACTAIGEAGSLRWDGVSGVVEQFEPDTGGWSERFRHSSLRDETYLAEWRHWLGCVDRRETPLVSGEDGLAALRIVGAAREAAASGTRVRCISGDHRGSAG